LHSWFSDQAGDEISKFAELRGRAAYTALPDFKAKIQQLQQDAADQAGNLPTRAVVDANTRRTTDWLMGQATRHADTQRTEWATNTAKDNITSATNVGGLAIQLGSVRRPGSAALDFGKLDEQMTVISREKYNELDPQGYDTQTLAVEVSKQRGAALKNWVETAATNPKDADSLTHALSIFERYTSQIDPASRLAIDKYVKAAAWNRTTDRLADLYTAMPGRTVDQTLSPEKRALLDTIAGSEVGEHGGYDTLYTGKSVEAVRPGFDYTDHPRVMFLAQYGPTSAFGRYQITKTTWDQDKSRFGLSDITPASQDQWASMKTDERYADSYRSGRFRNIPGLTGNLDEDLAANKKNPQFFNAVGHALSGEWTSLPGGLQPNDQTASFTQRFQRNIAVNRGDRSPIPNADEIMDRINNDPLLAERPELKKAVLQNALGKIAQQERAYNMTVKAQKDQSDAAEMQVFANIHSDKPTVTVQDIVNNPLMSKEAKERMTEQFERATGAEKAERTYGSGFYDLYRRVHAPEGDPDRITDASQLYGHVGPQGDLTVAGVDKLNSEIQGRKTPEGAAESEMKKQFLANARAQITGTDEGLHIKDPKGDELYLRLLAQVLPAYDAARKAGKSAPSLLNPESADYLGSAIANFKRPMTQWYSDMVHDQADATKAPGFDVNNVESLDDAVAAYKDAKISRAQALDLVKAHPEWGVKMQVPAAARPQVPMSR
jgi:muramidase (phage lysozyme)